MSVALPIAEQLIDTGRAEHPVFRFGARTIVDDQGQPEGFEILAVEPDGPAAQAGLVVGDTIIEIDGDPARSTEQLVLTSLRHDAGDTITVTFLRAGEEHTADITLGAQE
jgi:putative serine protease PepD